MKRTVAIFAALLSLSLPVSALGFEFEGVQFPDSQEVAGQSLQLNGVALFEVSFMKIDIYVGGLYVQSPTRDWKAIVDPATPKRVIQHYVVDGGSERIAKGWRDTFEAADPARAAKLRSEVESFVGLFSSVKKGQKLVIDWVPKTGVTVQLGKSARTEQLSPAFARFLFEVWVGPKAEAALRKGYLRGNSLRSR